MSHDTTDTTDHSGDHSGENRHGAAREAHLRELTDDGEVIDRTEYRKRSRRAFLSFGVLGVGGYLGFNRLQNRPESDGIPDVLRAGLNWNEGVWEKLERERATARTFKISDREELRVNGRHGIRTDVEPDAADDWMIDMTGLGGRALDPLPLDDVKSLEVHDMVWEHKCIEGWSNIVHWTGVRFSDVVEQFAPDETEWEYASLRTPDGQYYVGVDRYTMMHSQTMLAWQLNGEPLESLHGAPIRLVTPLKYGIKQLKRIGSIEFTNERPRDYWFERGYDFHAGF